MREFLAIDRLIKNTFLNFLIKFLYYTTLVVIIVSTIWTIGARHEAQGVFVLIPMTLYSFFVAAPVVLLTRIYLFFKKIEPSELFKQVSNNAVWLPWLALMILGFVVL